MEFEKYGFYDAFKKSIIAYNNEQDDGNAQKIVIQLNYAVIKGNYYFESDKLSSIEEDNSELNQRVLKGSIKKLLTYSTSAINLAPPIEYNIALTKAIERYIKFAKSRNDNLILGKNRISELGFGLKTPESIVNDFSDLPEGKFKTGLQLLWLNMALAEADENLTCSEEKTNRLNSFKSELQEVLKIENLGYSQGNHDSIQNIAVIIGDKIDFLLRKIEIREFISENEHFSFQDCANLLDFSTKKRLPNGSYSDDNCFQVFFDDCKNQYLLKKVLYATSPLKKINVTEFQFTTVREALNWSRYLRKMLKEKSLSHESALSEIKKVFEFWKIPENNEFEKFAHISAQNLLFNSSIKIALKYEVSNGFKDCLQDLSNPTMTDIAFVRAIFNEIKTKQDKLKIYDYHPYQSLMKFFRELIDKIRGDVFSLGIDRLRLDEKTESEYTIKATTKITLIGELYSEAIQGFQKNLKWCKSRKWNPIYLSREDTLRKYDNYDNIELFLDSSFILPDNFRKIEEDWYAEDQYRDITVRSTKNRTQFEIHRVVTESSVDKKKEEFERKVKENEFKMVQIVAMFVSIATFVMANVKIFENKSLSGSLSAMFAFAASLLLFNAFFKWLIRDFILTNTNEVKSIMPKSFFKRNIFTDYKYSVSDLFMLSLIASFGALSVYFSSVDDKNIAETRKAIKPFILRESKKIVDSLYNINVLDTNQLQQLEKVTDKRINTLVKPESLKK